jgi:dihydrolipoamide dehydrogenase
LVERDLVGGTCLHRGCIPTKAILHAAEVADGARHGAQFGVHATIDKIDLAGVTAYAESVVGRLYKGLSGLVRGRGIEVIAGTGRLVRTDEGPGVAVGEETYSAPYVVLATGSAARTLPGLTVDGEHILTSEHAWRLDRLPTSAVVLGGGVIGSEFASAWRSFGVDVTIVEALPRLLAAEEPAISTALERAFRKRGITVLTDAPLECATVESGGVRLSLAGDRTLSAEVLLVAVGRGPVSEGLGYAEAGVDLDRGFVTVDERLRTAVPGVYAVGDLVAGLQLAHRGFAHGIFVAEDVAVRLGRTDTAPVPVVDRTSRG